MRVAVGKIRQRVRCLAPELAQWRTLISALASLALAVVDALTEGIHYGAVVRQLQNLALWQMTTVFKRIVLIEQEGFAVRHNPVYEFFAVRLLL